MADTSVQSSTLTNKGILLATQLLTNENHIKSFRAVASDEQHYNDDPEIIKSMTNINSIKQEGIIVDVSSEDSNIATIQADFPQKNIDSDYPLYTVGLYVTDDNGVEILYSVQTQKYPDYMAKATNANVISVYLRTVVGNAANVNVQITDAGTVTTGMLDSKLEGYAKTSDIAKLIPKNTMDLDTNQTITAPKNFTGPLQKNGKDVLNADDKQELKDDVQSVRDTIAIQEKTIFMTPTQYNVLGVKDPNTNYVILYQLGGN